MPENVAIGRALQGFERCPQRSMMVVDGQAAFLPQLGIPRDVLLGQRIFEAPRDVERRDLLEQLKDMVVGPPHGEVVVDPETGRGHRLHGPHLVDDVLEGREVVLQPGVAPGGIFAHRLGHSLGVGRHGPAGDRNPGPVTLAEQLVDRHSRRLAHEVIHRHPQREAGLIPHPVEGVAAEVFPADRLGLQ